MLEIFTPLLLSMIILMTSCGHLGDILGISWGHLLFLLFLFSSSSISSISSLSSVSTCLSDGSGCAGWVTAPGPRLPVQDNETHCLQLQSHKRHVGDSPGPNF